MLPDSRIPKARTCLVRAFAAAVVTLSGAAFLPVSACAQHQAQAPAEQTYRLGDLSITAPWARATPGGAKVGGGFLKITNNGKEADSLTGGSAAFAGRVEVHEMAVSDGVMRMRELAKGLEIRPGETIELKPGSFHIMFMDLRQPLKQGTSLTGMLTFAKAGRIEVEFRVGGIADKSNDHGGHKH
jgi:periplasmic copper chaperone A